MGRYLGSWKLEDVIYVPVQTSAVTTGAATDAESVPTWRMYEDNTAAPITTGSFTTLNAQTGFYIAAITLASASGYEKGKSYSLRVAATVNAVIGADVHSLQIEAEVDANAVSVTVNANVSSVSAGVLTADKFGAGFITAGSFSGNALSGMAVTVGSTAASAIAAAVSNVVTVSATAQAAIADAVWDEPKSGHTTADTYGEYLDATVSAIASAVTAGSIGAVTVGGTAASAIAAAVANVVTVSSTSVAAVADAVWDEARSGHVAAGSFGQYVNADTRLINGTSVNGVGTSGDKWRG